MTIKRGVYLLLLTRAMSSLGVRRRPPPFLIRNVQARLTNLNQPYKKVLHRGPNILGVMPRRNAFGRRPRRLRRRRFVGRRRRSGTQPYSIVRRLTTVKEFAIDPDAGTIYQQSIKLNSAYDPTGTLGTGRPLGFDEYAALYQRSAIVGWKVKLEFVSSDNTNAVVCGFCPVVESTGYTSYMHYKEMKGNVSNVMTPDIDKVSLYAKGGVKRWFLPPGGKLLSDDTLTHGTGGDPSRLLYGHIYCQAMDTTANPGSARVIVTLEQLCCFYVPKVPSRST